MLSNSLITSSSPAQVFLSAGEQAISSIFFCNTSETTDCTVDVYAVPSGQTLGPVTQIIKKMLLSKNETFVFDTEKLVLSDGDTIWAQSTENNVVAVTISSIAM